MAASVELWVSASQWLRQIGALVPESPALGANAKLYDLVMALQVHNAPCFALTFFNLEYLC